MRVFWIICLLTCIGCATKKRFSHYLEWQENQRMQLATVVKKQESIAVSNNVRDSVEIMVIPKGIFKLDAQKGFEGEAASLIIRANRHQTSELQKASFTKSAQNEQIHFKKVGSTEMQRQKVEGKWLISGLMLLCCVAVLMLAYRGYKKWV